MPEYSKIDYVLFDMDGGEFFLLNSSLLFVLTIQAYRTHDRFRKDLYTRYKLVLEPLDTRGYLSQQMRYLDGTEKR